MAEIRLRLREAAGDLPDVCMCCGQASTIVKSKNMSWCPSWVGILILGGLLPYLIVAMILTKRMTVQVPLCDQHKGHWFKRTMWTVGTFFLFAAICGGALALGLVMTEGAPRRRDEVTGGVCVLSAILGVIWIVILLIAQNTAIRPAEITDRDITLKGVSQEFVDAVENEQYDDRKSRRSRDDDDDERLRKKRYRDDDDEDDEPRVKKKRPAVDDDDEPKPRKRRPSSDAIEED